MSTRGKRWLAGLALSAAVLAGGLVAAGWVLARRLEPFLREQTVAYLQQRLQAEVTLGAMTVSMPVDSLLELMLRGGKGALVRIGLRDLALRFRSRPDLPAVLTAAAVAFEVDLPSLWRRPALVRRVRLDGLVIHVPPRGDRVGRITPPAGALPASAKASPGQVVIEDITADGARVVILPKAPGRAPLEFTLHSLHLERAGADLAMRYRTRLRNPTPPGLILSQGRFGPWNAEEPGGTPLSGEYEFREADLSVFRGIAGTLSATGTFSGVLHRLVVDGQTKTPDFRLQAVGNAVPLATEFHAIVDGMNGNTVLQPVRVRLGRSRMVCHGSVVRGAGQTGRTVTLEVVMPGGEVEDVLRLALKGRETFLRGGLNLRIRFELPPGRGEIADRLKTFGTFELAEAHFTSGAVQDKIDALSRRGQGQPRRQEIRDVPSRLAGAFALAGGVLSFSELRFTVPGAAVAITGRYSFAREELDFRGALRLDARVSQTVSGWKRWALKPVDPIFARDGAGTLLRIRITGPRHSPHFGLDKPGKTERTG